MATNTVYVFAMKDGKYAFKTEIRQVTLVFSAQISEIWVLWVHYCIIL
jgi:hypothetical protein